MAIGQRTVVGTTMAPMTGYTSGRATRKAILLELLAREPQSIRSLATATGGDYANVWRMIQRMERDGMVTVHRAIGRRGSTVTLTPAGRGGAELLG